MEASRVGDEEQLAYILMSGIEDVGCRDVRGRTPLHVASESNQIPAMLQLLAAGALVTADNVGRTPIHEAADRGHADALDLLLRAGAYIEFRDAVRRTPLHTAARRGHTDVVRLLLDRGADISAIDVDARTALHLSSRSDAMLATTLLLCSRGSNVEAMDGAGFRPMHHACLENQPVTAKYLMELGADTYALDAAGWNPLVHAAARGYQDIVDIVAQHLLGPPDYPLPDPRMTAKVAQKNGQLVFGAIPGWLMAIAVTCGSVGTCLMCWLWRLQRYSRHQRPYNVHGGDATTEEFLEDVMFHIVGSREEQRRVIALWDKMPAHTIADVHRPKVGAF